MIETKNKKQKEKPFWLAVAFHFFAPSYSFAPPLSFNLFYLMVTTNTDASSTGSSSERAVVATQSSHNLNATDTSGNFANSILKNPNTVNKYASILLVSLIPFFFSFIQRQKNEKKQTIEKKKKKNHHRKRKEKMTRKKGKGNRILPLLHQFLPIFLPRTLTRKLFKASSF